jgi:hypothetical protein
VSEQRQAVQSILRSIENDWRDALEEIEKIHEKEREATRDRLAAIHRRSAYRLTDSAALSPRSAG